MSGDMRKPRRFENAFDRLTPNIRVVGARGHAAGVMLPAKMKPHVTSIGPNALPDSCN